MKSFFSKLSVLLFIAGFVAVGCQDYAEDIRELNDKVDKNMADVTVSTDALDDVIEDLQAQQAADKAAAENALAALETKLNGTNDAFAEAKKALEDAYKAADELVVLGYQNADATLLNELNQKFNQAMSAVDAAKSELTSAYKDADKAIEDAYKAADVEINKSIAVLDTKLQTEVARVEAIANTVDAKFKGFEEAYKSADAALDKKIVDLRTEFKESEEVLQIAIMTVDEAYREADKAINARIDAVELLIADLQQADKDLQQAIDKNAEDIEAEAQARVDAIKALTDVHNQDKVDLLAAIAVNSAAITAEETARKEADVKLQENIDAANEALEAAKKDLQDAIDTNADNIDALKTRVDALESWKTAAQQQIDANKANIAKLETDLGLLELAYKAADELLQKSIEDTKAALDAFKKTVEDTYATKEALTNLENTVTTEVNKLNTKIDNLETSLTALITANATAILNETNARVAAVKGVEDALAAAKKTLEDADSANKTELEGKIEDTKGELLTAIDNAKKELQDAINAEKDARELAISTVNGLISDLGLEVEALKNTFDGLDSRLTDLETWKTTAEQEIDDLAKAHGVLVGRVDKLEVLVDSLFNQIQSVVYKPTHANGKARIDYAKLEGAFLEGNSVITYKVYPKNLVKTIVDAFNENLLTLEYEVESVTKAGDPASLTVLSVEKGTKEGDLAVTVKAANLGDDFYNDLTSYSAALVLNYGAENFSTEYTNLVPAGTPTTYTFDLYVGDLPYAAEHQEVEYPATDPTKWTKTVLEGLNVKFSDGTNKYSPEQFFDIYPLAEALYVVGAPSYTNTDDLFIPGVDANGYVTAYLDETKVAAANVTKTFEVVYPFSFNGTPKSANGTIEIVGFPWTMQLDKNDAGVTYPLQLPYTDDLSVKVLPDYTISFTDGGTGLKTEADLIAEGYCVKVDTLDVVTAVTTAKGGATADLFEVTPMTDAKAPVSVKLAKENGVNKAVADNVETIFNVKYSFDYKVGTETLAAAQYIDAEVKIEKTMYSFDITVPVIKWTYPVDADADAAVAGGYCSRKLEYANAEQGVISAAYRTGSAEKTAMSGALTIEQVFQAGTVTEIVVDGTSYTGTDIANSPIQFATGLVNDDDKVQVELTELAWGLYGQDPKEYVASATYDLPSAIVTVNLTASTTDRNREAINIDLGKVQKTFAAGLVIEHNAETTFDLALASRLVAAENLGATDVVDATTLAAVLASPTVNSWKTYVDDTHYWETADPAQRITSSLKYTADFTGVTYGYHYGNPTTRLGYVHGDFIPKYYEYTTQFTTWYGQVINVALDFEFLDPKYDFAPVPQYMQGNATDGYFVEVNPNYTYAIIDGKLDGFSVNAVNLNATFDVVDNTSGTPVKMDATAMAAAKLSKKFAMIDNLDANIVFADYPTNTIIKYNGSASDVTINGYLTLRNTYGGNDTYYAIDETIFTGDYETFKVKKYDPIAENVTVREGKLEQAVLITEAKVYDFFVLDNYSLQDKLGNELIDASATDGANNWVEGADDNNIHNGTSVASIYGLTATYELKVVSPTTGIVPTGITVNAADGKISIDNTSQIVFANPVHIQARVIINYPQGQRTSGWVTYKFGDK